MLSFTLNLPLGPMRGNVHEVTAKVDKLVAAAVLRQQQVSTAYMKSNAGWHDRTGNARNGLHAEATVGTHESTLTLAHGVPYGIWLELRWAGRYAIILQAVETGGRELMSLLERGLARI